MRPGRVAYRVKQFAWAFAIRIRPQERGEIEGLLSPGELALFYGMRRAIQRHSLQVYRFLRRQGLQDRDLLAAALIHDVGQGRVTTAHRVAAVLLKATWAGLLKRLASPQGPRWSRGFYDHRYHAELGAEMARRAGCHPRIVSLICHHHGSALQEPPDLPGLAALRMADQVS